MSRLPRPHIPVDIRLQVVLRQIGMTPEAAKLFRLVWPASNKLLTVLLRILRAKLEFERDATLHLDHDPPLAARQKLYHNGKHVGYSPPANDPDHLFYREKVAHHIKTNVRGEHGQHPDRVLIKKARKLERRGFTPKQLERIARSKKLKQWQLGLRKQLNQNIVAVLAPPPKRKRRWQSRPFQKGKRRIPSRPFPKRVKQKERTK